MTQRCHAVAFAIGMLWLAGPALAADWFIDGAEGSAACDGSRACPLRSWSSLRDGQRLAPGDTVHFLPTVQYGGIRVQVSGTAAAPITLIGDPHALTKIVGTGNAPAISVFESSHVVIQYFDVVKAPGTFDGINVWMSNHVSILDNIISNAGNNGIGIDYGDYVTVAHNSVWGNGLDNANGVYGSGISTWEDHDVDDNAGVKMIIDGNFVYHNTGPGCATCVDTDGNGIILDDNRNTQSDHKAYRGTTLIMNNVVYANGGNGIHAYSSNHAIITGNSVYHNNLDPAEERYDAGEIDLYVCGDIVVTNNILWSNAAVRPDKGTNVDISVQNSNGRVTLLSNLGYNDTNNPSFYLYTYDDAKVVLRGNVPGLWGNPKFVRASQHPKRADFGITTASPALGAGESQFDYASHDILGIRRKPPITIGAYEDPAR